MMVIVYRLMQFIPFFLRKPDYLVVFHTCHIGDVISLSYPKVVITTLYPSHLFNQAQNGPSHQSLIFPSCNQPENRLIQPLQPNMEYGYPQPIHCWLSLPHPSLTTNQTTLNPSSSSSYTLPHKPQLVQPTGAGPPCHRWCWVV